MNMTAKELAEKIGATVGRRRRAGVDERRGAGARGFEASYLCGSSKTLGAGDGFGGSVRGGRRRDLVAGENDFEERKSQRSRLRRRRQLLLERAPVANGVHPTAIVAPLAQESAKTLASAHMR